jgi:hypothetical protein
MAFKAFDRTVSFAAGTADTKWLEAELARFARAELAAAQRTGEASRLYAKAVNGRRGVAEEQVVAPGAIVYAFDWMREATALALVALKAAAPKRSGRYVRSFVAVVNGRAVAIERLALGSAVTLVNTQPYSRKIQVGSKGFESRRGLFDRAARRVNAEFRGLVKARATFVSLGGAYRLAKGSGRRRDRVRGAAVTYPAIELASETVTSLQ